MYVAHPLSSLPASLQVPLPTSPLISSRARPILGAPVPKSKTTEKSLILYPEELVPSQDALGRDEKGSSNSQCTLPNCLTDSSFHFFWLESFHQLVLYGTKSTYPPSVDTVSLAFFCFVPFIFFWWGALLKSVARSIVLTKSNICLWEPDCQAIPFQFIKIVFVLGPMKDYCI